MFIFLYGSDCSESEAKKASPCTHLLGGGDVIFNGATEDTRLLKIASHLASLAPSLSGLQSL